MRTNPFVKKLASSPNDPEQLRAEKHHRMTTAPIRPLILSMAVPTIISMTITSVYNFADTWFISHIGEGSTRAVAAVGVIFSYMAIIHATGFFFGHGSGNFISRALGRQEVNKASQMAATGVVSSFLFGIVIALIGILAPHPLLTLLGTSPEIYRETYDYFFYICLATPFMTTSLVFNNQLRLQGNAHRGMIGIAIGAILNIALDPIFIFSLNMGISGASLATAISQIIGFLVLLIMTHCGDSITPKLKNFRPTLTNYREILAGGLPSLARQSLNAIAAIVINRYALDYGAQALAGVSIVARIMALLFCIVVGIGQGFQPVCGFNYGARRFDRVEKAYFETIKINTVVVIFFFILLNALASQLVGLFGSSAETADIAIRALHYQTSSVPFLGFIVATEMMLQNTRQTIKASVLAVMRRGLAYAPCIIVLNAMFELDGILWSKPAADFIALLFAVPFSILMVRKLRRMMQDVSQA